MHYELRLVSKASGVGYFSCCPMEAVTTDAALAYLRAHPHDEFMHKYVLDRVCACDPEIVGQLIAQAQQDSIFLAILCEAVLSDKKFRALRSRFPKGEVRRLSNHTPLIYLKSYVLEDQPTHHQWITYFAHNILDHKPLDSLENPSISLPIPGDRPGSPRLPVHIEEVLKRMAHSLPSQRESPIPVEVTAQNAREKLNAMGILAGAEMKHTSSLSPCGLYRKWQLRLSVKHADHNYTLAGIQTSFGRGLDESHARASCAMEMIERYSAFASFDEYGASGFVQKHPLTGGSYLDLQHLPTLDPNSIRLEVPYAKDSLYWIEGEQIISGMSRSIWVPVQCVFLFCNLAEVSLFSGLGSTGLASGNSIQQAKLNGLLEVIERDAEATSFYDVSRCFRLKAEDPVVSRLLDDYRARGIQVQFQDISHEFGIPCYKCFVIGPQGQVIKGSGAHLDGKKALLSALTETPYPYPNGPASLPGPAGIATRLFEELPDYSSGGPQQDLAILEAVLNTNGYQPVYVDITKQDCAIPVVKALIPGMELMADFDQFSRVGPGLLRNYLKVKK